MTKCLYIFALLLTAHTLSAQNPVPNSSFENWVSSKPAAWTQSYYMTQVSPGHTGSYAAQGDKTSILQPDGAQGFPISQSYAYLNFYYKFNKVQSEYLSYTVYLIDSVSQHTICSAIGVITTGATAFTGISIPISCNSGTPTVATMTLGLDINTGSVPAASFFIVDDISLSNNSVTGLNEQQQAVPDFSVSPNPAHNYLDMQATAGIRNATIEVYNAIGEKLESTVWNGEAKSIDMRMLPAGLYFVALRQGDTTITKKVIKD